MTFTDLVLQIIVQNSYFKRLTVEFKFRKLCIHLPAGEKPVAFSSGAAYNVARAAKALVLVFCISE